MNIGNLLRAVVIGGAMLHGASAQAAIALTLEDPGPLLHGQGQGSPCVIGGSACGNPADFGYRLLPTGPAGAPWNSAWRTGWAMRPERRSGASGRRRG